MSPSRMTLVFSLALAALLLAPPAEARDVRDHRDGSVRERAARTIVRLLPPQPRPARNFVPVPANESETIAAIWLERELIWSGDVNDLQDGLETIPFDRLQTEPGVPPWDPRPVDEQELCVGIGIRIHSDGHVEDDVTEIDCDFMPVR